MLHTLHSSIWKDTFSDGEKVSSLNAIENGKLIYLPKLSFSLLKQEHFFLTPGCLEKKSKNISLDPKDNSIKGTTLEGEHKKQLAEMLTRFSMMSQELIHNLFPHYKSHLMIGRTSYRPAEIKGRKTSIKKDDTRLHVDAFASTPNHGKRILRVFANINPHGQSRHWHLGESFLTVLNRFSHTLRKPLWGSRKLLSFLNITKSPRTLYDHYMLLLHDNMKQDDHYQKMVTKQEIYFPAGSSWIVTTDNVSHAALAGQYLLEQTFYLPVEGMKSPELSPLRILERHIGKPLVDLG